MNYMPEDQYSGPGRDGPYSGDYNSYNGGPHLDTSLHSSHMSLHSNASNRNRAQVTGLYHIPLSKTHWMHEIACMDKSLHYFS